MRFLALVTLLAMAAPTHARAQELPTGLRGDVLMTMEDARNRLISLVDAFSEEQLEWRPGEGVRSVREAIVHVAGSNYYFGRMLGGDIPEGINPAELEHRITEPAEIVASINASFDHLREVITNLDEAGLATPVQWFGGQERTRGYVLMVLPTHAHQHLGQLIAYARVNGVVPPWSE